MRPEKLWMSQNLKTLAGSSPVIILTDFTGLSSQALGQLRSRLKGARASYLVVKNRLLKQVVKEVAGLDVESVNPGPTGIAYGDDPVNLAKVLKEFTREFEAFKVKAGLLKDRLLNGSEVVELAKIPSRLVLLTQLVGVLSRPITGLVNVLNAPLVSLVMVLARVRDQKQQAEKTGVSDKG